MPPQTIGSAAAELRWWRDFWAGQPVVAGGVKRAPVLVGYFVVSTLLSAGIENAAAALRFSDTVLFAALGLCIIYEAWAQITAAPRQEHSRDFDKAHSAFWAAILYAFLAFVGTSLFIGPGIYVLVSASLAAVFIAIDGLPVIRSFEASRRLVSGHFWNSLVYLAAAPVIAGLGLRAIFVITAVGSGIALGDAQTPLKSFVDRAIASIFALCTMWILLSIIPMQVRLFYHLKVQKGQLSNPSLEVDEQNS